MRMRLLSIVLVVGATFAHAQTCLTANEMDERTDLERNLSGLAMTAIGFRRRPRTIGREPATLQVRSQVTSSACTAKY